MKVIENDVLLVHCDDVPPVQSAVARLTDLFHLNPDSLTCFRSVPEEMRAMYGSQGFELLPTVLKTTLFFDASTEMFFKILHPITLKYRVVFHVCDKAKSIHDITESLRLKGVKIQKVELYGHVKRGNLPLIALKRVKGTSLYDILILQKSEVKQEVCVAVLDEIIQIHTLGYWLGDAHLSHIFVDHGKVSGIIDVDSIRRNRPFSTRCLARDIAGINHPGIPLSQEMKKDLLHYYVSRAGVQDEDRFLRMVKKCSERRWAE